MFACQGFLHNLPLHPPTSYIALNVSFHLNMVASLRDCLDLSHPKILKSNNIRFVFPYIIQQKWDNMKIAFQCYFPQLIFQQLSAGITAREERFCPDNQLSAVVRQLTWGQAAFSPGWLKIPEEICRAVTQNVSIGASVATAVPSLPPPPNSFAEATAGETAFVCRTCGQKEECNLLF